MPRKRRGGVFVGLIYMDGENEAQAVNRQTCESEKTVDITGSEGTSAELWDAEYLAAPDAICPEYLERIVRRHVGLPWIIAETDRLLIREFTPDDIAQMPEEPDAWYTVEERAADKIFYDKDKLEAYIKSQYRFYEYGIWAVVRKADGVVVGKAGVTNLEEPEHGESEHEIMRQKNHRIRGTRLPYFSPLPPPGLCRRSLPLHLKLCQRRTL